MASASSSWGAAVRAVHLKVHPKPLSIGESREFLRVLRQFGEVTMFRHLKHDHTPAPHTYLAIFRHEDGAAKLLKASPLRVTLDPILPDPEAAENHPLKGQKPRTDIGERKEAGEDVLENPEFRLDASRRKSGYEEMTRASKILFEALDSIDVQRQEAQEDVSFDALVRGTKKAAELAESNDSEEAPAQPPEPLPAREFDITIDVSDRNHRDAISSHVFWSTYTPRVKSLAYIDLTGRGVSRNVADVSVHAQPPSRVFEKIRRHAEAKPTLRQIYEAGPGGKGLLAEWAERVTGK
ncbi:hypothetical protein IWZ01DRAFT_484332 [Phyllosticta capitalensis]